MNEILQQKIEEIRNLANDTVPEENENWCYSTGELCDRASHQARIELAKESIAIIDELQKKLNEMTICRDKALEQPFILAQNIVELRDEVDLAKETLQNQIEDITKRFEIKKYIAVIDKDFGVIFPDFDGCVSVGKDLKDAIEMAHEALKFHVDGMCEDGEELPEPKTLEQVKKEYHENVFKYQPIFIK
jgi:predicted RNase H-like HicB family nuclease